MPDIQRDQLPLIFVESDVLLLTSSDTSRLISISVMAFGAPMSYSLSRILTNASRAVPLSICNPLSTLFLAVSFFNESSQLGLATDSRDGRNSHHVPKCLHIFYCSGNSSMFR